MKESATSHLAGLGVSQYQFFTPFSPLLIQPISRKAATSVPRAAATSRSLSLDLILSRRSIRVQQQGTVKKNRKNVIMGRKSNVFLTLATLASTIDALATPRYEESECKLDLLDLATR